ncbi:MAG: tripartite tricarboxylate transporter TctB family protein [Roseitalea sp.]|jgi:putative tricarboxylic transport membrane protein|nr:tripartite tricarboxylate transporter TctB family protein [Roseitalea sp.]MBO6720483.1 tripartite tricarboxylate transporter TctB family protein [Roseitalea sp.]MBO6743630.1 tripartite tricarboxylate transporter TctB family protein [Roseitalea sp.]
MRTGPAADIVIGVAFAALGAAIIVAASRFRAIPGMAVGSGLFPTMTGGAMILFGLVMVIGAARVARRPVPEKAAGTGQTPDADDPSERKRRLFDGYAIALIVALLVLIAAMPVTGFLVSGFVFAVFAVRLGGGRWAGAIVFSAIATFCIYFVFMHGLRVPLPPGPF